MQALQQPVKEGMMPLQTINDFSIQQLHILDARILNLQRQGRLGTIPVNKGQEAAFCAPILALKETDWFVGSYRELLASVKETGQPVSDHTPKPGPKLSNDELLPIHPHSGQ
jgi:hypothetical protein